MAFSTWTALRTAIKDAIANHVAGSPCVGSYSIGDRNLHYRSFEELVGLLEKTYTLEALEAGGDPSRRVSYGRHRRFTA
jgi:hypothetical protein